jgi:peptidoglycan/xylan/chitin deacetylase (PgdA/CDA1 family)
MPASKQPVSCHCVAFRLDDIQDYFLNKVQIEIISTFERKNASLTAGIIGHYIGDDAVLTAYLREKVANSSITVEVANHGWNHEDFTLFDREEQTLLIRNASSAIAEKIGVKPTVFIPPYNRLNNDTIAAALADGIHYISGNATFYPPSLYYEDNADMEPAGAVYHFPTDASTGDLNADDTAWFGSPHGDTLRAVENNLDRYGYAVVMMHPMEFSIRSGLEFTNKVDRKQIQELELLIDSIHAAGLRIVTISQIDDIVMMPEFAGYMPFMALALPLAMVAAISIRQRCYSKN